MVTGPVVENLCGQPMGVEWPARPGGQTRIIVPIYNPQLTSLVILAATKTMLYLLRGFSDSWESSILVNLLRMLQPLNRAQEKQPFVGHSGTSGIIFRFY